MSKRNKDKKKRAKETQSFDKTVDKKEEGSSTVSDGDVGGTTDKGTKSKTKDSSWYAEDEQLLKDAASYPFSLPLGEVVPVLPGDITLEGENSNDIVVEKQYYNNPIPGVLTMKLSPSIGYSRNVYDSINVGANAVYSFVRHQNSGRKNYDPCDLMLYLTAVGQLYSFTVWMQRLYGYAFLYSARNQYVAKSLIKANGVNPDNLVANLANFRGYINVFINKISSWAVPNTLNYYNRMAFLYSGFYTEGESIKDQLYQFAPSGFWKFQLDENSAGMLKYKPLGVSGALTVSNIIAYAEDLISNIFGDEDFGIMSGDILKAYEGNIIKLASMPENYLVLPSMEPMVLTQFKNAHFMMVDSNTKDVTQDSNGVILSSLKPLTMSNEWGSNINSAGAYLAHYLSSHTRKLVNIDLDFPSPADIMESSRLIESIKKDGDDEFIVCGSEVIDSIRVDVKPEGSGSFVNVEESVVPSASIAYLMNALGSFKWRPNVSGIYLSDGTDHFDLVRVEQTAEFDNVAVLDDENVERLHEVALLSLFRVPGVAKL